MAEITWTIHTITDMETDFPEEKYIGNYHTHGLEDYVQKELCMVLYVNPQTAASLLNNMGLRVAKTGAIFHAGIHTDILQNGLPVELLALAGDEGDDSLYVILPDENGKLPSDPGCAEPYKHQYKYATLISDDKKRSEIQ